MEPKKPGISLTHLTRDGHAHMVGVGAKDVTSRRALARARVRMSQDTFVRLVSGDTPKGDVLAAARIAGIQAAKKTSELPKSGWMRTRPAGMAASTIITNIQEKFS